MKTTARKFDQFAKSPKPYQQKALKALREIHKKMDDHFLATGMYNNYPGDFPKIEVPKYKIGVAETAGQIREFCPDCSIGMTNFKIAAVGNIDDDDDVDVIIINDEGTIDNIINDLKAEDASGTADITESTDTSQSGEN